MEVRSSWLEPRQRILQRDGKRISIRLEEEIWQQLEFCAKDEGLKLTDLVFRAITNNPSVNRASLLRIYCARSMRKKLVQTHLSHFNADIQGILASCPIPCVIVTRERKLLAQNSAFGERILDALASKGTMGESDTVIRFSLAKPINRIVQDLIGEEPNFVETNVAFSRGAAIIQMLGRFCLLNRLGAGSSPLLCFLDPQRTRQ